MKIAIIGDSHFGARSDSPIFRDYFAKFYDEIFFPYILKNNINTVVHLGDFLDRRKFVNFETLKKSADILDKFKGLDLHIILGNHDTYYKNTSSINSLELLFKDKAKIYKDCTDIVIDGKSVALIPWINDENNADFRMFLANTKSKIAFGHFELQGFQVMRNVACDHGLDPIELSQFDAVYSGHFHQKHDNGKIFYLGTQYDMTFADVDEVKGFHVLDTDTMELEFIVNPRKLFYKIHYKDDVDISNVDLHDSFAKIIVSSKPSQTKFEKFLEDVYAKNPHDITVIEEYELFSNTEAKIDETKDTVTIICDEVDALEDIGDKSAIKNIITDLYVMSQSIEGTDNESED